MGNRLTNHDISTLYKDVEVYLFPSDLLGAFAYWVTAQNPNDELIDILPALTALNRHILHYFPTPKVPEKFTYETLQLVINDDVFEAIPEILDLSRLKPDFIGLSALARNMFYMILREYITQN